MRVEAKIIDVIEHEKKRLAIEERVIVRAEDALEGLTAILAVRRLEIEIVVAADIPPRESDRTHDRVRPRIEREVVEHDVAGGEAKLGVDAGQRLDQILADEVDFRAGLRLRIGHQHDVERLGSSWRRSGKSTDAGNGPVGAKPSKRQVGLELAGEPLG